MNASRFNLIDEQWIPVGGEGLVSLHDIFYRQDLKELGGTPVQKIALLKFLLAIAQAAHTPQDDQDWQTLTPQSLGECCLTYLDKWHDAFWLYGERPFLQMPAIAKAEIRTPGELLPHISTGNTTILFDEQQESELSSADRALLLLTSIGFGLGGKKTDNKVVLSAGYTLKTNEKGKPATGKPGAWLGMYGYLHHFVLGSSILETILFNLFTQKDLQELPIFPQGVGVPPWEKMPQGEDCLVAQELKQSLMGRLVPLSMFMLLAVNGIHYSDGIAHPRHLEGGIDPSVAYNSSGKKVTVLWTDPEKQPWRDLTALLSFVINQQGFTALQLSKTLPRLQRFDYPAFGVWAGGLRVKNKLGEQYVSATDDFVESSVLLSAKALESVSFNLLKIEMDALETLAKLLSDDAVKGYYKDQKHNGTGYAKAASNTFWQLCETRFQDLIIACTQSDGQALRPVFAEFARRSYNAVCPKDTAGQIKSWAKHQPKLSKYFN